MSNVYVWNRLDKLTDNYHCEGGLVVVAGSLDRAREIAVQRVPTCDPSPDPDQVWPLAAGAIEEQVFCFPDAGCC